MASKQQSRQTPKSPADNSISRDHHAAIQVTLLERMGGEPMLNAIIKGWYRRIFQEEELKRFFRNVDMKKVTSHQYELLWVLFTRCPEEFDFMAMIRKKHERLFQLGLNELHYDRFMSCLESAMLSLGIQRDLVEEASQRLGSMRHVFSEGHSSGYDNWR